jgi:hypothetical protein
MAKAISVIGPEPKQNRYGDEYPVWVVGPIDNDGEPVGKQYEVTNRERAISLGQKMAADRRLEFVNEAGYA